MRGQLIANLILLSPICWAVRGDLYDPSDIRKALWDGPSSAKQEMAMRLALRDTPPGVKPVRYCTGGNFTLEQNRISLRSGVRHISFAIYAHHDCMY